MEKIAELEKKYAEGDVQAGLTLSEYWWGHSQREKSLEITRHLAEDCRVPRAMNNYAWMLETGDGAIPRNRRLAYRWYCRAVCAGDALAMSNLADKCFFDKDVEYVLKGFSFAFTAAEMGEVNAILTMMYCFTRGIGAVQDFDIAASYLEEAGFKPGDRLMLRDNFGITKTDRKEQLLRMASLELKERLVENPFNFEPANESVWVSPGLQCYPAVFDNLKRELESRGIPFRLLPGEKNKKHVWARDYMPIQIGKGQFLQQRYAPDYLKDAPEYIPDYEAIVSKVNPGEVLASDLVLDGGNILKYGDSAIMTDKVLWENPGMEQDDVLEDLMLNLHLQRITLIPWDMAAEPYGHADGMVRFINENSVVISNFSNCDLGMRDRLVRILSKDYIVKELHFEGKLTPRFNWGYINFLKVGDRLFVPQFGIQEDAQALEQLREIYLGCEIIPIFGCETLAKDDGVLNCVTWTIKE